MNKITTINGILMTSQDELNDHVEDGIAHVTTEERATWDAKMNSYHRGPLTLYWQGQFADERASLTMSPDNGTISWEDPTTPYRSVDLPMLIEHPTDDSAHVTEDERLAWNSKADASAIFDKVDTVTFNSHTGNDIVHVTAEERATWNAKQDTIVDNAGNMTLSGGLTTGAVINANGGVRMQNATAFTSNQSSVNKYAAMGFGALQQYGMQTLYIDPAQSRLGNGSTLLPVAVPGQLYKLQTSLNNRQSSRALVKTCGGCMPLGSGSGYNQYRGIYLPFNCDRIYTENTDNPYWIKYTFATNRYGSVLSSGFRDALDDWDCYISDSLQPNLNMAVIEIAMLGGDNPTQQSTFRVRIQYSDGTNFKVKTTISILNNFHMNEKGIAGFLIQGSKNGKWFGETEESGKVYMIRNGITRTGAVSCLATFPMPEAFEAYHNIYVNSYCNNVIFFRNPIMNFKIGKEEISNPLFDALESEVSMNYGDGIISETIEDYVMPDYSN